MLDITGMHNMADNEFGLLEWQKALRHFMLNSLIKMQLEMRELMKQAAAMEQFLKNEATEENLKQFCAKCPLKDKDKDNL